MPTPSFQPKILTINTGDKNLFVRIYFISTRWWGCLQLHKWSQCELGWQDYLWFMQQHHWHNTSIRSNNMDSPPGNVYPNDWSTKKYPFLCRRMEINMQCVAFQFIATLAKWRLRFPLTIAKLNEIKNKIWNLT